MHRVGLVAALLVVHVRGLVVAPVRSRCAVPPNHPLMSAGDAIKDCLVIGGGISGSTLAHNLHRQGVDVLLAEARRVRMAQVQLLRVSSAPVGTCHLERSEDHAHVAAPVIPLLTVLTGRTPDD